MHTGILRAAALLGLAVPASLTAADVIVGSHDDFNGVEFTSWTNGQVADPQLLPGGPGGAADTYLRVTSDGSGSGGKLTVFNNDPQWTGNWYSSGVNRVEMDLFNFDPQGRTLFIRMGFLMSAGPGQPGWCTNAFQVPADGQWHHAVFLISQADLTRVGSALDYDIVMSSVTQVRIFHSTTPSAVGTNFASSVGIDNIVALPTPSAAAALAALSATTLRRRRR